MNPYSILRRKKNTKRRNIFFFFQKIEPGDFFQKVETDQPASRVREQPIYTTNNPLSSRDRAIFTFSEFEARQSLNRLCHFAISWAGSCQYQCVCKISSQYSTQGLGHFHFFRIWSSAKPRPMINVILQSLGLDLVNVNVYA